MSDKFTVKLGNYSGIKYPKAEVVVPQGAFENFVKNEMASHTALKDVDRTAKTGDTVVIDYAGFLGDKQFDGGTSQNFPLELGSHTFIPGFEEQLVGSKAGDDVDVNVTFPEVYHSAELAGKAVVFKCKVHAVQEKTTPELTDEFVKTTYGFENVAAFNDAVNKTLEGQAMQEAENKNRDFVVKTLSEICEVEVSDEYLEFCLDKQFEVFTQQVAQQGGTIEEYCQYFKTTPEQLRAQIRPQAEQTAKITAIMETICEAENVTVTDAEFEAELNAIGASYGMNADMVKKALPEEAMADIRKNISLTKTLSLVMSKAIAE